MDEDDHNSQVIGNYRLLEKLDCGSFGCVHRAEHLHLKKPNVAIKVLHAHLVSPQKSAQFLREAQILEELAHPYILPILDVGIHENKIPYLVLEYCPGGSLKNYLQRQQSLLLPFEKTIDIITKIGQALHHAHQHNIVHRDLKPANILFNVKGEVVLTDFGIAKLVESTMVTNPAGTLAYMAPEQFQGIVSQKSDQFALGCIAYELMTRQRPFLPPRTYPPIPPSTLNPLVPPHIQQAILKALSEQRADRHTDVIHFINALEKTAQQWLNEGQTLNRLQKYEESLAAYEQALRLDPNNAFAYYGKGDALYGLKRYDEALVAREQAKRLDPTPISALRPTPSLISQESKSNTVTEEPLIQRKTIGDQIKHNQYENNPDEIIGSVYTVLDIGTDYAKAMIIEVKGDVGFVLGVGRHQQSYSHMSDGIVTDVPGVIISCNEALTKAEQSAGGIIARSTVIGIGGELVKGSSITISKQRAQPTKPISPEELESMISSALQKLLKIAKERIDAETGYPNIEVRLINAAVISVRVDGQTVSNPISLRGRHFTLTLFSAFAPLMQLGALETVAKGLDLTLITIVAEPYALAQYLSANASANEGAIFIDIGGGTTDIALVRQGGIEETRMFALGGRTFTRRLAASKGLPVKEAEKLKLSYSSGGIKGNEWDEIQNIFATEAQTWMDSVELLVKELAKGELLPPAIYLVGGSSGLPDLRQKLEHFPWTERLPFSSQPILETIQPGMVTSIADPHNLLRNAQDITPMALAYQVIELQNEDNVLERVLYRVIHQMHI